MTLRRSPLLRYITFKGRLGRKQYFMYHIILIIGALFFLDVSITIDKESLPAALAIFGPMTAAVSLLFSMRRFHDMNRPGWYALIMYAINLAATRLAPSFPMPAALLGCVSFLFVVVLFCKKGTAGENPYGPDPLVKKSASLSQ